MTAKQVQEPRFLADKTATKRLSDGSKKKTVRCERTALYGVCQAITTTSSSLQAYPPTQPLKAWQLAVDNAGRPLGARFLGPEPQLNDREGQVGPANNPTQAKRRLEWATPVEQDLRPPLKTKVRSAVARNKTGKGRELWNPWIRRDVTAANGTQGYSPLARLFFP
jgi:hypothetical protein